MTKKTQNKDRMIALLQVRNQLQAIRSFMETMIDDVIQQGVEKLFVASIRITTDKDNYSFSVGYYPKNNYVKVFYKRNKTPFDFFGDALVDNWIHLLEDDCFNYPCCKYLGCSV